VRIAHAVADLLASVGTQQVSDTMTVADPEAAPSEVPALG
jgi:hypothetical protein